MSPDKGTITIWVGRLLSALVIAFLVVDGSIKLVPAQPVIDTFKEMGWPTDIGTIRSLGVILLASTALYASPRTAILGAILLTGYLGGAVATHLRIGSPMLTHTLFGIYVGVLMWLGLYLRNPEILEFLTSGPRFAPHRRPNTAIANPAITTPIPSNTPAPKGSR
jgi:hypothetical protein